MRSMTYKNYRGWIASLALLSLPFGDAWAQDVELLVTHVAVSNGADGVRRSTEFSERVSRTKDSLWISRVLAADAHSDGGHTHAKNDKAHKHIDVTTATRWLTRDATGALSMRLVPNDKKVLVAVSKTDYSNIGFDGSWAAAWSLIDPASLKRMKAGVGAGDLTTYTLVEQDRTVKVIWNARLQIPVSVESADKNTRRETIVKVVKKSSSRPWDKLEGFTRKDYSDYLD